jgi:hypothetical protein
VRHHQGQVNPRLADLSSPPAEVAQGSKRQKTGDSSRVSVVLGGVGVSIATLSPLAIL